jgi:hypothetical protein
MNVALRRIFFHTSAGFLTCKILKHGVNGFTSSSTEGMLRIFIALKNPSPSNGIENTKLGSKGKHVSHYTTEADIWRRYSE